MQYITLNHQVTFYVPSTNHKDKITNAEFIKRTNEIANTLSETFGGASIQKVKGFYKADSGEYITETINKVVSFCTDVQLEHNTDVMINLASSKCKLYEQESIGLEIDNKFYLID